MPQNQRFRRLAGTPPHGAMTHSVHSLGSAALNFSHVAPGTGRILFVSCSSSSFSAGVTVK